MKNQKLFSVGDLAHRHGVHESEVIEWAQDNDVPKLGREFAISQADAKKFGKWMEKQLEEAVGDDEDADDDGEDGDDAEEDEDGDDEDEEDDD